MKTGEVAAGTRPRSVLRSACVFVAAVVAFAIVLAGPAAANAATGLTLHEVTMSGGPKSFDQVIYADGMFVAVGAGGTVSESRDGVQWTSQRIAKDGATLWGIAYGDGKFVAVADGGEMFASVDGVKWDQVTKGIHGSAAYGITYGPKGFVAVGATGGQALVLWSSDGIKWQYATLQNQPYLNSITYFDRNYITVGNKGEVLTSSDILSWNPASFTTKQLWYVTHTQNAALIVGEGGAIAYSTDGTTWQTETSGTSMNLYAVAYGNSEYVAVGHGGTVLTSPDAQHWTQSPSHIQSALVSVAFGNGAFVLADNKGHLFTTATSAAGGFAVLPIVIVIAIIVVVVLVLRSHRRRPRAAAPLAAGEVRCPHCGQPSPADSRFCVGCGQELHVPPSAPAAVEHHFCGMCGHGNTPGSQFCDICGSPLSPPAVPS